MKIYTYSEARQRFSTLLEQARREGAVGVRRRDGQTFVITPETAKTSPLDIAGIHIPITRDEIVSFAHEGRRAF
jgi:hypothetical protein